MNNEHAETIRDFDEISTMILGTIPGFLWSFYSSLITEGFTPDQAMALTEQELGFLNGAKRGDS